MSCNLPSAIDTRCGNTNNNTTTYELKDGHIKFLKEFKEVSPNAKFTGSFIEIILELGCYYEKDRKQLNAMRDWYIQNK